MKLLKKKSTINEFQEYNPKTGITENEYENIETEDFVETTGFSNPAIAESVSHLKFKVCNKYLKTNH